MGCELNPRVLGVDWKYFCELRPGLLGWIVVDLAVIVKAWSINTLTPSLVLACLFHFIYVADALYYEVCEVLDKEPSGVLRTLNVALLQQCIHKKLKFLT